MSTTQMKSRLIALISTVNDNKALKDIYELLTSRIKVSTEDAKIDSIKRGLSQIQNGNTLPHKEAKKIYQKWL
jgi:predicted transcriptional regulator